MTDLGVAFYLAKKNLRQIAFVYFVYIMFKISFGIFEKTSKTPVFATIGNKLSPKMRNKRGLRQNGESGESGENYGRGVIIQCLERAHGTPSCMASRSS